MPKKAEKKLPKGNQVTTEEYEKTEAVRDDGDRGRRTTVFKVSLSRL